MIDHPQKQPQSRMLESKNKPMRDFYANTITMVIVFISKHNDK